MKRYFHNVTFVCWVILLAFPVPAKSDTVFDLDCTGQVKEMSTLTLSFGADEAAALKLHRHLRSTYSVDRHIKKIKTDNLYGLGETPVITETTGSASFKIRQILDKLSVVGLFPENSCKINNDWFFCQISKGEKDTKFTQSISYHYTKKKLLFTQVVNFKFNTEQVFADLVEFSGQCKKTPIIGQKEASPLPRQERREALIILPLLTSQDLRSSQNIFDMVVSSKFREKYDVYSGPEVEEQLEVELKKENCTAETCVQNLAIKFNGELVADPALTRVGSDIVYSVQIRNAITGRVEGEQIEICEECTASDTVAFLKKM